MELFIENVKPMQRKAAAEQTQEVSAEHFPTFDSAKNFLFQIILPPSMRWGFISVGKSGSSSTLRYLFQAEFGCEFTAKAAPLNDINPSAAVHMLTEHGVFSRAFWRGLSIQELISERGPKERICVVRNPHDRAISAFRYLCQSHVLESRWFARDRFRMNAVVGFDWGRHTDTLEGFILFLEYIKWQVETEGADRVNGHWRSQFTFVKPPIFRPTIVGRIEDMNLFFRTLSERLEKSPRDNAPWENSQSTGDDPLRSDPRARALCEQIYAADYEAFGY